MLHKEARAVGGGEAVACPPTIDVYAVLWLALLERNWASLAAATAHVCRQEKTYYLLCAVQQVSTLEAISSSFRAPTYGANRASYARSSWAVLCRLDAPGIISCTHFAAQRKSADDFSEGCLISDATWSLVVDLIWTTSWLAVAQLT